MEHGEGLQVVREPERYRLSQISRVQAWRLERLGKFPKRIQLGENSVGWVRRELEAWILERMASRG